MEIEERCNELTIALNIYYQYLFYIDPVSKSYNITNIYNVRNKIKEFIEGLETKYIDYTPFSGYCKLYNKSLRQVLNEIFPIPLDKDTNIIDYYKSHIFFKKDKYYHGKSYVFDGDKCPNTVLKNILLNYNDEFIDDDIEFINEILQFVKTLP